MKKLVYVFVLIALASCASKKKWDKESLVAECKKEGDKDKEAKELMTDAQRAEICDCAADKALVRYKSADEMEKDDSGATAIGRECAMWVMMPKSPDFNVSDTTQGPDSTNQ